MKITDAGSSTALSRRVSRDVPEHWGKSELTKFLQLMENQIIATFAGMPNWFQAVERVDKRLAGHVSSMFHEIDKDRRAAAMLYIRSIGTFRAAVRLGLSGQLFESTVLTRSIIESAVYAWACGHSKGHREAWVARAKGENELKEAKKAFQWKTLGDLLASVDAALNVEIQRQYKASIDFGAHPNEQGVSLSTEIERTEGEQTTINTIFAHGPEAIRLAALTILQAMGLVYRLLFHTIGDRLRILGIDREIDESRRFVLKVIEEQERNDGRKQTRAERNQNAARPPPPQENTSRDRGSEETPT